MTGKTRKDFEKAEKLLASSQNEEEAIEHLTSIVKGFSSDFYLDTIRKNPYFMSIFESDIRGLILEDLNNIRKALSNEMKSIESRISESRENQDIKRLKEIRQDCELLISEIDIKIEEVSSI
jgi:hypothetical protein